MANAAAAQLCRFQWNIRNPFLPFRRLKAPFYHGSPTPTEWEVSLVPSFRHLNAWHFTFSLGCSLLDETEEIVANRIWVDISINRKTQAKRTRAGFRFRTGQSSYRFDTTVVAPPREEEHVLAVSVEITFASVNTGNRESRGLFYDHSDLARLSGDLRRLYETHSYSDMILMSRDFERFDVHSCILEERWGGFLADHPKDETDGSWTVFTDISAILLRDILTYIYTGAWRPEGPGDPAYATELFQVVRRYGMHLFYKVFTTNGSELVRTTLRHLDTYSTDMQLLGDAGERLANPGYTWHVNTDSDDRLIFQIQFFLDPPDPWFRYSVRSMSSHRIYVQVNLDFTMNLGERTRVEPVHGQEHIIPRHGVRESGECRFEGGNGSVDRYIRCILSFSDGTSVFRIKNENIVRTQDDQEGFEVLSSHMRSVLYRRSRADFRINCPCEWPIDPNKPDEVHDLHKSIFTARVPVWRTFFENILMLDDLPDSAACSLGSEAFQHVARYIYTGKARLIAERFLDDVDNIAARGGFEALRSLVIRMRLAVHISQTSRTMALSFIHIRSALQSRNSL